MRGPSSPVALLVSASVLALTLAQAPPSQAKPRTHRVYSGQTLGMIAKRYNVSVQALRNANGLDVGRPIKPKQELVIPERDDVDGSRAREQTQKAEAPEEPAPPSKAKAKANGAGQTAKARDARANVEPREPNYAQKPKRPGYVTLLSTVGSWRGQALTKKGKIPDPARNAFHRLLASWRTGDRTVMDEDLLRLLIRVSDHFGGRPVRIVSGFRPWSATQYTPHSRHNLGQAVDFSVLGVPNTVVRDYCRTLGSVGVGYYPNSSFIHLDVRETKTYWVDYSGPGEAPRYADARGRDPGLSSPTIPASTLRPIGVHDGFTSGSVQTQARPNDSNFDLQ